LKLHHIRPILGWVYARNAAHLAQNYLQLFNSGGNQSVRICVDFIAAGVAVFAMALTPTGWTYAAGKDGLPRQVSPRGDLGVEERATIDLFERSRDSVVFITTSSRVQDFWSRNVFSVPRGTGSGFIWDESGAPRIDSRWP
jgi:S1-C subfamily serine protease